MKRIQIILFLVLSIQTSAQPKGSAPLQKSNVTSWFPFYDFNPAVFKSPHQSFGPMARWWWPGNNVTQQELKREINLFADNSFAGVEVQPLNLAIPIMDSTERARVTSWDTPEYYENLRAVMEEAQKRNLIVDVTIGSGWPAGGPFLQTEDGFLSLEFGAVTVTGGSKLSVPLPPANNRTSVPSKLQAVVVYRLAANGAAGEQQTVALDAASAKVVTSSVQKDTLTYTFPAGQWKVIAFWAVPSNEKTNIAAVTKQGPVVDHFDSLKVLKLYDHLFGERTHLQPYFGKPMRAIFSDSYEFKANRHYAPDFLAYFKKKRGYDLTPYLPVNMQKGYNFVAYMRPNAKPDFSFSDQDWRLRYDYDITLGELLGAHFLSTSKIWAEKRGLLFRTQAYGLNMDMMAMAGLASIPETESMLGSEANIKVMTSGALLYNRPVISGESVVFANRAYTTTPQKIKLAVDKLFAAGVNQIIYHGVPYRYTSQKLGPEGWYPFSSPVLGMVNFASNLGEGNIYWKEQHALNEYVTRVQYALRSGRPHADVLIYYPFLDVGEGTLNNDEEILTKGDLKGVEGPLPKTKENGNAAKAEWAEKVFPMINQLEANGISWSWVNDASIQAVVLQKDGNISIRGNSFQALILANDSIIHVETADKIKLLASAGMRLLVTGKVPYKQPSYLNWKANDARTAASMATALKGRNSKYAREENELSSWLKAINLPVAFNAPYHFTRQAKRDLKDGSRLQFIWNKSDQWQQIQLTVDKKFKSSYWMDPTSGAVIKNKSSTLVYQLAPYGSVLLFASTKEQVNNIVLATDTIVVNPNRSLMSIEKWNIAIDSLQIKDTTLFDWRNNVQLQFSSANGVYNSSIQWQQNSSDKHVFLDLGRVSYTSELYINGSFAGKRIYAPFVFDITQFLKAGNNTIEVRVTPGQLNDYIGKAKAGDTRYIQFKGKEDQVMSAGLIGPVVIRPGK